MIRRLVAAWPDIDTWMAANGETDLDDLVARALKRNQAGRELRADLARRGFIITTPGRIKPLQPR